MLYQHIYTYMCFILCSDDLQNQFKSFLFATQTDLYVLLKD